MACDRDLRRNFSRMHDGLTGSVWHDADDQPLRGADGAWIPQRRRNDPVLERDFCGGAGVSDLMDGLRIHHAEKTTARN